MRLDKNGLRTIFSNGVAHLELEKDGTLHLQGMHECGPLSTPMEPGLQLVKLTRPGDPKLKHRYLQATGSLMYAMLATCPDLCCLVRNLSRFIDNPSKEAWNTVIHMFRYIASTLNYGLHYTRGASSTLGFSAYLGSDWALPSTPHA